MQGIERRFNNDCTRPACGSRWRKLHAAVGTQLRAHRGQPASRSSTEHATRESPSACASAAAAAVAAWRPAAALGWGMLLKHWGPGVLQHLGTGTGTACAVLARASGAPAAPGSRPWPFALRLECLCLVLPG
jgi:hypothetical protein